VPSENDLRDLFANTDTPAHHLDTKKVIARSRARRLPRQIAAGATSALVLAGVSVLAVQVTQANQPVTMTAGEAFDSSAPAPELAPDVQAIKRAPADRINLCTGTLAEVAPSQYGLQLDVTAPAAASVGTTPVPVTVRLTNTSDREVIGLTPVSPAITLSRAGTVLWHSNGPTDLSLVSVDLVPGASVDYQASMTPVLCGVEDDLADAFRTDLPALDAGSYELSALIDFTADPSMGREISELDLVSGPVSTVILD